MKHVMHLFYYFNKNLVQVHFVYENENIYIYNECITSITKCLKLLYTFLLY
jgi:hypothetical protein